jgi:Fungal Zn(2)-Cys(6) binuclear cluster domain
MDQNPLSRSYQALQSSSKSPDRSKSPEALPRSPPQKRDQATGPPLASSRIHGRTPIRKSKPPSCNLCRRCKIKCDRADPCSHCVRVDAVCISAVPSGAPRGRQGGRCKVDSELLDRIAKLEHLVNHLERGSSGVTPPLLELADGNHVVWQCIVSSGRLWNQANGFEHQACEEPDTRTYKIQPEKPGLNLPKEGLDRYLGSSLWMNLSDEVSIPSFMDLYNERGKGGEHVSTD